MLVTTYNSISNLKSVGTKILIFSPNDNVNNAEQRVISDFSLRSFHENWK